jgi:hypothetical protein
MKTMQIINTQFQPINFQIENNAFGINQGFIDSLNIALCDVDFITPIVKIQTELSNKIVAKFKRTYGHFTDDADKIRCHPRLNYKYDGVFITDEIRIGLEIQFRPDFLKDITRFQIGFHSNEIKAMIYIVAIDRNNINPNYTSMPQYNRVVDHLNLFSWLQVPILVVGINCNNNF